MVTKSSTIALGISAAAHAAFNPIEPVLSLRFELQQGQLGGV